MKKTGSRETSLATCGASYCEFTALNQRSDISQPGQISENCVDHKITSLTTGEVDTLKEAFFFFFFFSKMNEMSSILIVYLKSPSVLKTN